MNTISVPAPFAERPVVRVGATLLANVLRAAFAFFGGVLTAKGLGPAGYGDLSFLLGTFVAISPLLEMGTSAAFYTFISRRPRGWKFLVAYLGWIAFQFAATVIVIGLLLSGAWIHRVWVGHERSVVLLSFAASFFTWHVWGMVVQLGEARRKTVFVQSAAVVQAALHLGLIAAARFGGWLTIRAVLWLLIAEYGVLASLLGWRLIPANLSPEREREDTIATIGHEFATYCKPLAPFMLVAFLHGFADRWFLQRFGGAVDQGFYAMSLQFASISLIATMSILQVFWKEVAEARERQDGDRVQELYTSASRGLFFIGAWFGCLLMPYSRELLIVTVGPQYEAAWLCLTLMLLYPAFQSLREIQVTFFYAEGSTKSHSKIGLVTMAIGIPLSYVLLAPGSAVVPGLALGAIGLAVKTVAVQVIGVGLRNYAIARENAWLRENVYQVALLGALIAAAWLCRWISAELLSFAGGHVAPLTRILVGCGLYAALSWAFVAHLPAMVGLTRGQIQSMVAAVTGRLRPVDGLQQV